METDRIIETLEKISKIDLDLFRILSDAYQKSSRLERFLKHNTEPISAKKFWIADLSYGIRIPASCESGRGNDRGVNVYLKANTEAGRLCRLFVLSAWTQVSLTDEGVPPGRLSLCRVCGHQIIGGRSDKIYCSEGCKLKVSGQADLMRKRKRVWQSKWQHVTRPAPFTTYCRWLDKGKPLGDYGLWLKETFSFPSP